MTQSAGNHHNKKRNNSILYSNILYSLCKGSSETIRENSYDLFRKSYLSLYNKNIEVDNEWLDWFIGFIEGDGAILGYNKRCGLIITQKDISILVKIKDKLGIGRIRYFYKDNTSSIEYIKDKELFYGKYSILDIKNILLMYILLNGNLRLLNRKLQLKRWYLYLQKYTNVMTNNNISANNLPDLKLVRYNLLKEFNLKNIPDLIELDKKISLNDGWLSGFTDAEGCFSIRIYKQRTYDYVRVVYILDQKDAFDKLNEISELFSEKKLSKLRKTKNGNMYRIEISCNDINKDIYKKVINYFDKYPLKTIKNKSYLIWKEILYIILGNQPLNLERLNYIRSLRKKINKYIIQNKSIGHSNKS